MGRVLSMRHNESMAPHAQTNDAPGPGEVTVGDAARRYRCNACGNLTRFDVTSTVRSRSFHHYTVGGELRIEDTEVLDEHVEEVSCRWCSNGSSVVAIDGEADGGAEPEASGDPGAAAQRTD